MGRIVQQVRSLGVHFHRRAAGVVDGMHHVVGAVTAELLFDAKGFVGDSERHSLRHRRFAGVDERLAGRGHGPELGTQEVRVLLGLADHRHGTTAGLRESHFPPVGAGLKTTVKARSTLLPTHLGSAHWPWPTL